VDWDELGELTSGAHWTLASVRGRFEAGDRGWAGYGEARQTLAGAIKALDILPARRR
jgi:bifunctional non-homologous end joining protein LigD